MKTILIIIVFFSFILISLYKSFVKPKILEKYDILQNPCKDLSKLGCVVFSDCCYTDTEGKCKPKSNYDQTKCAPKIARDKQLTTYCNNLDENSCENKNNNGKSCCEWNNTEGGLRVITPGSKYECAAKYNYNGNTHMCEKVPEDTAVGGDTAAAAVVGEGCESLNKEQCQDLKLTHCCVWNDQTQKCTTNKVNDLKSENCDYRLDYIKKGYKSKTLPEANPAYDCSIEDCSAISNRKGEKLYTGITYDCFNSHAPAEQCCNEKGADATWTHPHTGKQEPCWGTGTHPFENDAVGLTHKVCCAKLPATGTSGGSMGGGSMGGGLMGGESMSGESMGGGLMGGESMSGGSMGGGLMGGESMSGGSMGGGSSSSDTSVGVLDSNCFYGEYTAESCCKTGLSINGKSCWNKEYKPKKCCSSPTEESHKNDSYCYDNKYTYDTCCKTGLNAEGELCWDEYITPDRCCKDPKTAAVNIPY